jgi:hypothetical protein
MLSPHLSGRVTSKQEEEVFGHAHWWLPELQLPQAPPPAEPHGPQEEPQQNQEASLLKAYSG